VRLRAEKFNFCSIQTSTGDGAALGEGGDAPKATSIGLEPGGACDDQPRAASRSGPKICVQRALTDGPRAFAATFHYFARRVLKHEGEVLE
jgi:hypothetical protein